MPTNNQVAHVYATSGPFTVVRADGCVLTNPVAGIYELDFLLGRLARPQDLKITVSNGSGLIPVVQVPTQTKIRVTFVDSVGVDTDPTSMTVTVEIVPRVS